MEQRQLLTREQLAKLLQVSESWVKTQTLNGTIPCHRLGPSLVRYDLSDVREYLNSTRKIGGERS